MRSNVYRIKLSVKRADTLPIYTSLLYSPLPFVDQFWHHLQLPLPLHFTYATILDLVPLYPLLAFCFFVFLLPFQLLLSQVLVVRLALSSLVISVTHSKLLFRSLLERQGIRQVDFAFLRFRVHLSDSFVVPALWSWSDELTRSFRLLREYRLFTACEMSNSSSVWNWSITNCNSSFLIHKKVGILSTWFPSLRFSSRPTNDYLDPTSPKATTQEPNYYYDFFEWSS